MPVATSMWSPNDQMVGCTLEFFLEEAVVTMDGLIVTYPIGRVIEFRDVKIVASAQDLPYWCGDPRQACCSGRFLRCAPAPGPFPKGILQIFRANLGSICWTKGYLPM